MNRLLAALLLVAASAAEAQLSAVEEELVVHIAAHQDEALELLERAVNLNSGTMNFAGVREVGDLFRSEFESLGFESRWIEGAAFDRAGHLVAERSGAAGAPHLLLIGHLDTVFEPHSPFQRFERVSETAAKGPGVTDMKGGNVVMVYALRALASAGVLDELRLTVVLTGDEEKTGKPVEKARAALVEAAAGARAAIGFEDGDGKPETAVIARRGSTTWTLEVTGLPAHSSQIFQQEVGAGAIYEVARILASFYEELASEPDLTFSPGVIVGGTDVELDSGQGRGTAFGKTNVVAASARVMGDLRALSPQQHERAVAKMRSIVASNLPQTGATLTLLESYPPMAPTDGNRRLLALYDRASRDLGFGPVEAVNPRNAGAADVSFVADRVPLILDGIGLMGSGGHTLEETADLATLPSQTARAAVLLHRLGRELRAE